jgi:hypothetical protein
VVCGDVCVCVWLFCCAFSGEQVWSRCAPPPLPDCTAIGREDSVQQQLQALDDGIWGKYAAKVIERWAAACGWSAGGQRRGDVCDKLARRGSFLGGARAHFFFSVSCAPFLRTANPALLQKCWSTTWLANSTALLWMSILSWMAMSGTRPVPLPPVVQRQRERLMKTQKSPQLVVGAGHTPHTHSPRPMLTHVWVCVCGAGCELRAVVG